MAPGAVLCFIWNLEQVISYCQVVNLQQSLMTYSEKSLFGSALVSIYTKCTNVVIFITYSVEVYLVLPHCETH